MQIEERIKKHSTKLLSDTNDDKIARYQEVSAVRDLYSRFYKNIDKINVLNQKSVEYYAVEVFQAMQGLIQRVKFPEFTFEGAVDFPESEKLVEAGLVDVMHRGDLPNAYAGVDGAMFDAILTGRGYLTFSKLDKKKKPMQFRAIAEENLYIDPRANAIHGSAKGKNARYIGIVFAYTLDEAYEMYPVLKEQGVKGSLPREEFEKDQDYTHFQESQKDSDMIEIMEYYNIDLGVYAVIAGSESMVVEYKEGNDYPYIVDDEKILPVFALRCFANVEGFYSPGIGTVIARSVKYLEFMTRARQKQIIDSTYSYDIINVPLGHSDKFFENLLVADQLRDNDKRAFVVNEIDTNSPQSSQITSQTLTPQTGTTFIAEADEYIQRVLRRFGIRLDEVDAGGNKTATQILSEVKSQNLLLEQIGEFNAPELQAMFECVIEAVKTIPASNKTIVRMRSNMPQDMMGYFKGKLTFGMTAEELRKYEYFPHINWRTGYLPSEELRKKELIDMMPFAPQGSPAHTKILLEFFRSRGMNVEASEISGQPAQPIPQEVGQLSEEAQLNPQTSNLLGN